MSLPTREAKKKIKNRWTDNDYTEAIAQIHTQVLHTSRPAHSPVQEYEEKNVLKIELRHATPLIINSKKKQQI